MTTRRRKRDPYTRTVVRLPERDLAASILHLVAPLLEPLGSTPPEDEARRAIELAIDLWNAYVAASKLWGDPRPKPLADLRKAMCGRQAVRGGADTFELLSSRWQKEFVFDPRLVGEAEVPPPTEKRIAIGGAYLDEVRIRQDATSYLSFPVENHRGVVADDGIATIHAKMPTVVQLFAEGRLSPVGGAPVAVTVGGKKLGAMVLTEVRCTGYGGHLDDVVLVFRPASASAAS